MTKQKLKTGDEYDWVSKHWRLILVSMSRPGKGKAIKNGMNRRLRRAGKREARADGD